jgi:hypothetical protein
LSQYSQFTCQTALTARPLSQKKKDHVRVTPVAHPGIFFFLGGGSTNSVEDRENGDVGAVGP